MLIIETGILWRRVAKRFEERVNAALKQGYVLSLGPHIEHRWMGLRILFFMLLRK